MIKLHKFNGAEIIINAEMIESVEATPDTVINLVTGNRFIVTDTVQEVVDRIVEYKKKVYADKNCVNPIEGLEKKPSQLKTEKDQE